MSYQAVNRLRLSANSVSIFWCTGPVGMIQREDFWDTIARNVLVYREGIVDVREHSILLANGSEVTTDAIFCGTGWLTKYPFLSTQQSVQLGLPHAKDDDPPEAAQKWKSLLQAADKQVIARFPQLADPPACFKHPQSTTTTRLYNCIAPLTDSSIVFLGAAYLPNAFRTAEAQAIFATACLDGNFQLPLQDQAEQEIAYMAAFSNRRYPSHGAAGNYFNMDLVGYTDKIVQDVGLVSHRRRWWWQDFFLPCVAADYSGIKNEYLAKCKKRD